MSTRSITVFKDAENGTLVTLYRHCDGYPEGMGHDLRDSFAFLKEPVDWTDFGRAIADFITKMNRDDEGCVEVYPPISLNEPEDIVKAMEDTDWEYGYIVETDKDENLIFTVANSEKILFRGVPRDFDATEKKCKACGASLRA